MLRQYSVQKSLTNAKNLRQNSTEAEKMLWKMLRNNQLGYKFRRQTPVGKYIADFVCVEKCLIIELDGGQHNEHVDQERTAFLEGQGFTVLRFWNNEILQNAEGACHRIIAVLNGTGPHPDPLLLGEGI